MDRPQNNCRMDLMATLPPGHEQCMAGVDTLCPFAFILRPLGVPKFKGKVCSLNVVMRRRHPCALNLSGHLHLPACIVATLTKSHVRSPACLVMRAAACSL